MKFCAEMLDVCFQFCVDAVKQQKMENINFIINLCFFIASSFG